MVVIRHRLILLQAFYFQSQKKKLRASFLHWLRLLTVFIYGILHFNFFIQKIPSNYLDFKEAIKIHCKMISRIFFSHQTEVLSFHTVMLGFLLAHLCFCMHHHERFKLFFYFSSSSTINFMDHVRTGHVGGPMVVVFEEETFTFKDLRSYSNQLPLCARFGSTMTTMQLSSSVLSIISWSPTPKWTPKGLSLISD